MIYEHWTETLKAVLLFLFGVFAVHSVTKTVVVCHAMAHGVEEIGVALGHETPAVFWSPRDTMKCLELIKEKCK